MRILCLRPELRIQCTYRYVHNSKNHRFRFWFHTPRSFRRNFACNRYEYTYVKNLGWSTWIQYEHIYVLKFDAKIPGLGGADGQKCGTWQKVKTADAIKTTIRRGAMSGKTRELGFGTLRVEDSLYKFHACTPPPTQQNALRWVSAYVPDEGRMY